jgi:hypothetical protein
MIKYIAPNELRTVWDEVRTGLEAVRAKGHSEWLPEDIYCDCFEQRAMLWMVGQGFMVLQPNGKELHIWAAYSSNHQDVLDGLEHAKAIAKQGGCDKLTFSSVRRGWEKSARLLGFKPKVWSLEI